VTAISDDTTRRQSPPSLHQRIGADIKQRILSGTWPPGHRIPFEHELMVTYGCSRMTVSKALSAIAHDGLIERRRRAGSFVTQPHVQSAVLEVPDIRSEITATGRVYAYELISRLRRKATKADRQLLDLPVASDILAIECRHLADGRPFALERRLIDLAAVPEIVAADLTEHPPGSWLLAHVPWTQAEHRISATEVAEQSAQLLNIEVGAACLVINRRTWRASQLITTVQLIYPGAMYELVARFGAQQQAQRYV
jgi:GntR family transcriptional regulator, histidine utilization repressor